LASTRNISLQQEKHYCVMIRLRLKGGRKKKKILAVRKKMFCQYICIKKQQQRNKQKTHFLDIRKHFCELSTYINQI